MAYDDDPSRATALIASGGYGAMVGDFTTRRAAVKLGEPATLTKLMECTEGYEPYSVPGYVGPMPHPLLFLHERTASSGERRIVVVHYVGESRSTRSDPPKVFTCYQITLIEPRSVSPPQLDTLYFCRAGPSFPAIAVRDSIFQVSQRGPVRFFAGRPDQADSSRFYLPYEVDGARREVLVRLFGTGGGGAQLVFDGQQP